MMRFKKNFTLFLLIFIPFFSLGAFSASLLQPPEIIIHDDKISTDTPYKNIQTTILLYKENKNLIGKSFPESIDILVITRNLNLGVNVIHVFPTSDKNSDLILIDELFEYQKKHSMSSIIDFFNNRDNLVINGMILFDDLAEKSISEWLSISMGEQTNTGSQSSLGNQFCVRFSEIEFNSLSNLNLNSLLPKHLSIILDTFTRFQFRYIRDTELRTAYCELIN